MNAAATVFERNPGLPRPAGRAAWAESLTPVLEELRETLRRRHPQQMADQAGIHWDEAEKLFHIQHLDKSYRISWPELEAGEADSNRPCDPELQTLFLYYLEQARGKAPEERWVTFRELPDGIFYHRAFQGYTGDPLAVAIDNDLERLRRAAISLGGYPLTVGDMAFRFLALPRIPLALVYWLGDDEFPPEAQVLFDPAAGDYLPIDGSAALGRRLVRRILEEDRISQEDVKCET